MSNAAPCAFRRVLSLISDLDAVLMGDSASLSFLDFLRHTFLYYMGPSPFTDKERAKAMLESVFPLRTSDDIPEGSPESHLIVEEKRDYIERFFIAVSLSPIHEYPPSMYQYGSHFRWS